MSKIFKLLTEKPENWEEIKDGFTQSHGCENCGNIWVEQLEWNEPSFNHIIMQEYCKECNEKNS